MYAEGLPAEVRLKAVTRYGRLPFVFEASGSETHFTNGYDPQPRARRLFAFPQPGRHQRRCRRRGDRKSGVRPGRRGPGPSSKYRAPADSTALRILISCRRSVLAIRAELPTAPSAASRFGGPSHQCPRQEPTSSTAAEPGERSRPDVGYTGRA